MNWTQPICTECFNKRNPERQVSPLLEGNEEICYLCGSKTTDGLYVFSRPNNRIGI